MGILPQFPVYIPSKGRSQYMMTSKALTQMGIPHFIVVEPNEVDTYRKAIETMKLLTTVIELDMTYKERYELCDNLGFTRGTGPGPARNFIWDHSISQGYSHHWVMDDNLKYFVRKMNGQRIKTKSPGIFRAMEDFVLRYSNIAMSGPEYEQFGFSSNYKGPFRMNCRVYSCNLIRNDISLRWRGRYNEDTILSIDMLKAGWCTVQFLAFLQRKSATQVMKGGNTDEFYHKEGKVEKGKRYTDTGTLAKSQMLANVHPDMCKVAKRFSRIHHIVNYRKFSSRKLILREGVKINPDSNEYGMRLVPRK